MFLRPRGGILMIAFLATGFAGCVARRLAPPPRPAVQPSLTDLAPVHLYLREFAVAGLSEADTPIRVEALQNRFLDYLESRATFADVTFNLKGNAPITSPALELKVRMAASAETSRTWLLDVLNVYPFCGGLPLVPAWGEAETAITVILAPPDGPPIATYRETVRAPYSALFFAWYRVGFVEDAFARAAGEAFRRIADALPADINAYRGITRQMPSGEAPALFDPSSPTALASPSASVEPNVTVLEEAGYHIITRVPAAGPDGSVLKALKILGGLEFTELWGVAKVSSKARLESGAQATVASGTSREHGYRISLYSPPTLTGAFVYPVAGYLNQQIDNVDVHSTLSELNLLVPNEGDIGAVATDPETGGGVDAGAADVYHLAMQSGYGGFRTGFNLVSGGDWIETFMSATLGLNLVEYRKIQSILDECGSGQPRSACQTKRQGWDFLKSGAVGGSIGVRVPKLHTALRLNVDYEIYRKFTYDHPLNVRGPPIFDPDTSMFSNENVYMRGASLSSWVVQLALGVVF
jgi:hypothetical protein